jgi:hypothetical protein
VVDELPAVIGIQTDKRERQASGPGLHRPDNPFVGAVADRDVRRPPGGHIGGGERAGEFTHQGRAAVRDEVRLDEPRNLLVFLSGAARRTTMVDRSSLPAFVADRPFGAMAARVGRSILSMVAPDMVSRWARTSGLTRTPFSSPKASSFGSHSPMVAARYLPDGMPASRQTLIRGVSVSYP